MAPAINFDIMMDIAIFISPTSTKEMMTKLTKKVGEFESTRTIEAEKGKVRDPALETAIADTEALRDLLATGEARIFRFALYFTIYARSPEELNNYAKQLESLLGGLFYTNQALFQMEQGFNSTFPLAKDELNIYHYLDTGSLSTTFPFISSTLAKDEGIMYGINIANNSLIIFDRFSLENANMTVFGTSGGGKSFAIKLEILRYLMLGTDIIVIDPENEYKTLCQATGGSYVNLSLKSNNIINPFDLPPIGEDETGDDVLKENIATLKGLISIMVGGLTPEEDGLLEKALFETYALKDITADEKSQQNEPPLLSDLFSVLSNMKGAETITRRLQKYIEGIYSGLFNQQTNVNLKKGMVVFSIQDLDDNLRPIAMYLVMHYIWNKVKAEMRRRILVIDEAWWMMQYDDSARFLCSMARRARKYYLGLTIISQNVEDFLTSKYGRTAVTNCSLQLLLKQSPAAIKLLTETFALTKGEHDWLLTCDVGEGLFFAGLAHAVIKIFASPQEYVLITSKPEELMAQRSNKQ
jgi:type IV secretory pathway VirB4 component